jgi:hypothetical protein
VYVFALIYQPIICAPAPRTMDQTLTWYLVTRRYGKLGSHHLPVSTTFAPLRAVKTDNNFSTTALLFDPETSADSYRNRVAYVVAHELAHQWFGNLVTMDWWSELWLNEGFATWVGWFAIDHLYPGMFGDTQILDLADKV